MRVGISVVSHPGQNTRNNGWGQYVMLLARMSRHVPWAQSRRPSDAGERNATRPQVDPGAICVDGVVEPPKQAGGEVDRAVLSWMQGLTTVHMSHSPMMSPRTDALNRVRQPLASFYDRYDRGRCTALHADAGVSRPYVLRLTHRCCVHLRAEKLSQVHRYRYSLFKGGSIRRRNVCRHFPIGANARAGDAGWRDDPRASAGPIIGRIQ